ncbi:MAG: DUF2341 domain-containing protein, partial [Polyangiaceae bacterium]|nr:DUF2341 domain-containing protein [Polyangiaceae bacterium]
MFIQLSNLCRYPSHLRRAAFVCLVWANTGCSSEASPGAGFSGPSAGGSGGNAQSGGFSNAQGGAPTVGGAAVVGGAPTVGGAPATSMGGAGNTGGSGGSVAGPPSTIDAAWKMRRSITLKGTQAEALVDFPVLVQLTPQNFDFASAKSAGEDLRFTDSMGVALDHEIEAFGSSSALIWVRVPLLPPAGQTAELFLYYGNPNASALPPERAQAVWPAASYLGVWHLSDTRHLDSGPLGLNGQTTAERFVQGTYVPGKIGNSFSMDSAKQDHFSLPPSKAIFPGISQISFSGWAKPRGGAQDESRNLIAIGNDKRFGPGGHPSFDISYDGGQLKIRCLPNEAQDGGPYVTETATSSAPELVPDVWVHLGVEINVATKTTRVYENGVLAETFENIPYAETAFDAQHVSQDST